MSATLIGRLLRANAPATGAFFVVIAFYAVMVAYLFDPSLAESLDAMMAAMPELFAAFGMATAATTLTDFLLNYLQGLILTLLPLVLIIMMVSVTVVRPAERGSMAGLLALPTSRVRLAVSFAAAIVLLLAALLVLTTVTEVACSEALFPGELDVAGLVRANAGLFGLWLFMAGAVFASACAFAPSGAALGVGGGACLAFYLMQMAAGVGEGLALLGDLTPFALYDAYGLVAGEAAAVVGALALAAAGAALFAAGVAAFARRDLSV
ncbi:MULTISPECIES: hypothetical protein [unclassified Adlercreutzia]|uniref:hypothetical protein n=1 Tax=unclassified Adlercreutzia TaxID=2636013 RepID=UPI0013EACCA4|nr:MULTISPECIES: hypothetical protein [unclassified Adlercreutzia]